MTSMNVHTINRELFEFRCLDAGHAFQVRNRFSDDVRERLSSIISEACDDIDNGEKTIVIPTLEIDLGRIFFDNLEEEIVWAFKKSFVEKLSEFKSSHRSFENREIKSSEFSLATLQYFLITGHLPWFAGKQDEYFLADLFKELFNEDEETLREFIFSNLDNDRFIDRLMANIDSIFFNRIIGLIGLEYDRFIIIKKDFNNLIAQLVSSLKSEIANLNSEKARVMLANKAIEKEEALSVLHKFENFQTIYENETGRLMLEFILKMIAGKNDISIPEKFSELFESILSVKTEVSSTILNVLLSKNYEALKELQSTINAIKIQLKDHVQTVNKSSEIQSGVKEVRFYISNAGLILIANYLPAFFNQLKLLNNGNFIDNASQLKAIFLLHYLCSGKEEVTEYIVPLNKILCGLQLDEPIPQKFLLGEEEKQECYELLNAVIENWERIGNMSIEGFREAFLNREGVLFFENNQWTLKVERQGYDVLLDSLPWSFSYTKLSWMQDSIFTEW
jgi:hypothetical protein